MIVDNVRYTVFVICNALCVGRRLAAPDVQPVTAAFC